jgi:hypothetical protein
MAHSGTTIDLGGIRPATNETAKRPGLSRAPVFLTLGVAVGLAVGAGAWAISTARTTSTTGDAAAFGAVHEKIEAHQAAVAAGADRANDQIEVHRIAAANAAAGAQANSSFDQIEAHRTMVANEAAGVFDHRLDNVVRNYALPTVTAPAGRAYSQGIVLSPTPRVFDPGGETPDSRGGVPAGIAPDYYRPYVDASRVVVAPKLTGTGPTSLSGYSSGGIATAATGGYPWRNPLP